MLKAMDKIKLPRSIIAKMVDNNPQAIKALENMQLVALDAPDDIKAVVELAQLALDSAVQAMMMANQQASNSGHYLSPVAVPVEQTYPLDAVNVMQDEQYYLGVL